MPDYRERIKINHDGNSDFKFFTESGEHIATGYERIVFGGRGPYIEFKREQVFRNKIHIPSGAEWRINNEYVYYYEYRTNTDHVMVYLQKATVGYADYKVGFAYITPFKLYDENKKVIIEKLKKKNDNL